MSSTLNVFTFAPKNLSYFEFYDIIVDNNDYHQVLNNYLHLLF